MEYLENRSKLLEQVITGNLQNTVDASTRDEIYKRMNHRDYVLLEQLLKGKITTQDFIAYDEGLRKLSEDNAIIFDNLEEFAEFCCKRYDKNYAKGVVEHEGEHARIIEEQGLKVKYGVMVYGDVKNDQPFVLDNLAEIGKDWTREQLLDYLKAISKTEKLGIPSVNDANTDYMLRRHRETKLQKLLRILNLN